jgi:hypothetical protein
MNCRLNLAGKMPAVGYLLSLGLFVTVSVQAQPVPKATGELVSAGQTTINGSSAISGTTIFSNNRIRTAQEGTAIVNLGKFGRLRLGADTDLTLQFSPVQIAGELHSGRAVISAPSGVAISILTPRGTVGADGRQSTTLTIEIDSKRSRIIAHRGEANLNAGSVVERIEAGEEIVQEQHPGIWRRRRLPPTGSQGPGSFVSEGQSTGHAGGARNWSMWELILTIAGHIDAAIDYSIAQLTSGQERNTDQLYNSTITCRDHYTSHCRRRGRFSP